MSRTDEIYKRALAKTKIPLLVLDNNWHKLFTQTDETPEIRKLEKKLNELLKEQGKSNTEQKKLKACKRKLMDEIIQLADRYGGGDRAGDGPPQAPCGRVQRKAGTAAGKYG